MQLAYIKHLAELIANTKPLSSMSPSPYYSQFERDTIADLIDLRTSYLDMVQTAVKALVGEYAPFEISLVFFLTTVLSAKIALNVNADKAAVLGAALYGASFLKQFKTKPHQGQ